MSEPNPTPGGRQAPREVLAWLLHGLGVNAPVVKPAVNADLVSTLTEIWVGES